MKWKYIGLFILVTSVNVVVYQNCQQIDLVKMKSDVAPEIDIGLGNNNTINKYTYSFANVELVLNSWQYRVNIFDSENNLIRTNTFQTNSSVAGFQIFKDSVSDQEESLWFVYNSAQNQVTVVNISSITGEVINTYVLNGPYSSSFTVMLFDHNGDGIKEFIINNIVAGGYHVINLSTQQVVKIIPYSSTSLISKIPDLTGDNINELIFKKFEHLSPTSLRITTMVVNGSTQNVAAPLLSIPTTLDTISQSVHPQLIYDNGQLIYIDPMGNIRFYTDTFTLISQRNIQVPNYNRYGQYHYDAGLSVGDFDGSGKSILYSAIAETTTFQDNQTVVYMTKRDVTQNQNQSLKQKICTALDSISDCNINTSCIYQRISSLYPTNENDSNEISFVRNCSQNTNYNGTVYIVDIQSNEILFEKPISTSSSLIEMDHIILKSGPKE
jgi:hypothetical protein